MRSRITFVEKHWKLYVTVRLLLTMIASLFALLSSGCGELASHFPEQRSTPATVEINSQHNPKECGTITGQVTWVGAIPHTPLMTVDAKNNIVFVPNPHAPTINPNSKSMAGAVVYLRGIDPSKSKPWGNATQTIVEAKDDGIVINNTERIGFVKRGEHFSIQSNGSSPHVIRGRGCLNFSIPLPEQRTPSTRIADRSGRIELTSGSNVAPAIAHLFVCDHPYYTVTNAEGVFTFDSVPAGEYELIVWHPNWQIIGHDRNPETGLICRYRYGEAMEKTIPLKLKMSETATLSTTLP